MLNRVLSNAASSFEEVPIGTVLLRRGQVANKTFRLLTGRVAFGVIEDGALVHQLGVVEGPFWLEAAAAMLGLPHVVDAVQKAL